MASLTFRGMDKVQLGFGVIAYMSVEECRYPEQPLYSCCSQASIERKTGSQSLSNVPEPR